MNTVWSYVLRGCVYGDAWGHVNEFQSCAELTAAGPRAPDLPERLLITDDTQMTVSPWLTGHPLTVRVQRGIAMGSFWVTDRHPDHQIHLVGHRTRRDVLRHPFVDAGQLRREPTNNIVG
jgi:hypothetical protein